MTKHRLTRLLLAGTASLSLVLGAAVTAGPAEARAPEPRTGPGVLTNTAHLDFLLDQVSPAALPEHTTYRLADEPALTMPWTYADARAAGTFERVGGGPEDPVTGDYGQGAFNADDVSRAAVVYLRHWRQVGDDASRRKAYQLLRGLTYLQTATGPDRGNVVLWMQADGDLNPSAEPVELPDPSDSEESYWLARTLWALGEGYAAFADTDPAFAAFLQDRLQLSVGAVRRQVLDQYGRYTVSDGRRVPRWLIVDGADATAEAALGLSAYLGAAPQDRATRRVLGQLLEGVAAMATARSGWPYGAVLPWAESRSMWHAWSSQMAGALALGSATLRRPALLRPAVREAVAFDPTLLAAGGPDNAWYPTPVDRTQIAYGADSRVQNLLATADAARLPGLLPLAAMNASWFFGTNRSGAPVYDPATGVTFDGVAPDGTVNRNSGAESTIHGLLTMLALDAHPTVRAQAVGWTRAPVRDGLVSVEAETATATTGSTVTPTSAWTGESQLGGGAYLRLDRGERARLVLGADDQPRLLEPVVLRPARSGPVSRWSTGDRATTLRSPALAQGISPVPGVLLPQRLGPLLAPDEDAVAVRARSGTLALDAVLARPQVSRVLYPTAGGGTELLTSAAPGRVQASTTLAGPRREVRYDRDGVLVSRRLLDPGQRARVEPGGFTVVSR
ncbi:hypothetical protein SAMN04488543_1497 [Friedmanniella luteola]|uniref:D-glucuronyl C5-epimerase C-terminus n=1 Tax=Friedmanniella luteola TaxID=546871 RepID=A0A1H1R7J0_9ACTN|nr:hypothetical protein [Friedmanniella luteola]SDS31754.1 hypothetical protein SAMN04488543_1497 [Friedmanniella luteola]